MKNILYFYDQPLQNHTVLVTRSGQILFSSMRPKALLQKACLKHGCSYEGARESFAYLTKARRKIPVAVFPGGRLIFIPVYGQHHEGELYLQYDRIERVQRHGKGCRIQFKEGLILLLDCDPRRILKQIKRCSLFLDQIFEFSEEFQQKEGMLDDSRGNVGMDWHCTGKLSFDFSCDDMDSKPKK